MDETIRCFITEGTIHCRVVIESHMLNQLIKDKYLKIDGDGVIFLSRHLFKKLGYDISKRDVNRCERSALVGKEFRDD
jgi:hypothetical protein